MSRWYKGSRPGRSELIDRKHQIEGEIRQTRSEISRLQARGAATSSLEAGLSRLQTAHYQTRLQIDQAEIGS